VLGFNAQASNRIVDMRECHILRPELFALVDPLRRLLGSILAGRGTAEVSLTLCDSGVDVALSDVSVEGLAATEALTAFAERHGLARLSVDEGYGLETRFEPAPATVTLSGVRVAFPPRGFLQATEDGEAALVRAVRQSVGESRRTVDLFAGLETFALALEGHVVAAEAGRHAVMALLSASRSAGRTLEVQHRDLYRRPFATPELSGFEAAVLDPPRAGAEEQVRQLASSSVPKLSYVSCNPATFARDARLLSDGGYKLDWVRPVGQFRWSTHIELAAAFSR